MSDDLLDEALNEAPEVEEAKAEPTPEPEPEKVEPEKEEMVPVSVLTATRQELQAQRDYWQGLAQQPKPETPEPQESYDVLTDPDKLPDFVDQKVNAGVAKATADISYTYARRAHGEEKVQEAVAALQSSGDAGAIAAAKSDADPYGYIVDWYRRQQVLAEVGDDPEAYKAKVRAEVLAEIQAKEVVKDVKGTSPPSLAGGTNAGTRTGSTWAGPTPLDQIL